jgi:hypothetical protein
LAAIVSRLPLEEIPRFGICPKSRFVIFAERGVLLLVSKSSVKSFFGWFDFSILTIMRRVSEISTLIFKPSLNR